MLNCVYALFTPSTTYDVRLRVQYCGTGGAWTGYSPIINVTMGDVCHLTQ